MTHDEVRGLLPGYAAGALDDAAVEVVHAHLAGGCQGCLDEVYRRPIGIPRPVSPMAVPHGATLPPPDHSPAVLSHVGGSAIDAARGAERHQGRGALFAAVLAALLGVASLAVALRVRSANDDPMRRLHVGAPAPAWIPEAPPVPPGKVGGRRQLDAVRPAGDPGAAGAGGVGGLAQAPGPTEDRPVDAAPDHSAGGQARRLLEATEPRRTLQELAILPGVNVLRLAGRAPVAGHVVWHPDRSEMVLSVSGLAPLPSGVFYRVRVMLANGNVDEGVAFRPRPSGAVAIALQPRAAAGEVAGVDVLRESDETPVLTGRTSPAG